MAKKKGPPKPRNKTPEELKEEAFRLKCEEAAKARAQAAPVNPSSSAAVTGGIKIVRPASNSNLASIVSGASMKKSASTASLSSQPPVPTLSAEEEEAMMGKVTAATTVDDLLEPLGVHSDKLQRAAADALKTKAEGWSSDERMVVLERMMGVATSEDAAERRGGAMAVAALVACGGARSIGLLGLWDKLDAGIKNKKQQNVREGSALVLQALAFYLGRSFEPHIDRAIPILLTLLTDGNIGVRDAAVQGVTACIKGSSYHGAGRAVPLIASVLSESKWTCKAGALQLLISMARICPATLYAQFPTIMPLVRDALAETHPKVKLQAEEALEVLCEIVEYPEVVSMIDAVRETLVEPVAKMADCLDVMMDITFVNAVDAPPLELVVPILSRALKDRKADLRKKAAKMCGNMLTLLLHPGVLVPHVPSLLPGITAGLVESQPEVREVCAQALAGMVQGMGGQPVYELLPKLEALQEAMTGSPNSADREKAHSDLEDMAAEEVKKCTDAISEEERRKAGETKQVVDTLHSLLKQQLPSDTPPEVMDHAKAVVEAVLMEALTRADGKGALHAQESTAVALDFLKAYIPLESVTAAVSAVSESICKAANDIYGVQVSGDERIVDLRNIILAYPGRVLLQRSHLHMDRGHCYGLVGQNGVGKTTIMTRIAQQDIHNFPKDLKCVYVQHEVHRGKSDALETVLSFMKSQVPDETEEEVIDALHSVGFSEKMVNGPVVDLSGGWRMKLAIARAMLQKADILLLDEPTNHLDAASVAWLAGYIQSLKNTTVMVVSHDADFQEKVVTDVIHIHDLKLTYYTDGFGNFRKANPALFPEDEQDGDAVAEAGAEDQANDGAEGEEGAGGTDDKVGDKPYGTFDFTSQPFNFPDPGKLDGIKSKKKPVLTMSGVSFRYEGSDKDTLTDINVKLTLASRVALIGANGAGKTTLLRLLVEDLPTNSGVGEVWKHHNLRLAYVAQHSMHHLEANIKSTPIAYIQDRFGFGKDKEVENKVTVKLSAEEKALAETRGEIGVVMGRRTMGKTLEYEVLRTGRKPEDSQWFNMNDLKLQKPYVMKLVKAYDEKMAAMASGADQRPISTGEIKKHLKDFGINEVLATGKIKNLSGGQKSRLVLAAAMWSKPHLLALDEPTNYIDRETLAALAESLKTFNGGVFLISHNAAFVEEVCNEQWLVTGGTCQPPIKMGKDKKGKKESEA